MQLAKKQLILRNYITAKALLITKKIELISTRKFIKIILNIDTETFVIHIKALKVKAKEVDLSNKIIIFTKY